MSAGNDVEDYYYDEDDDDEEGQRTVWQILSWIAVVLTIVLNLALVGILIFRKNVHTAVNKVILTIGVVDLLYGVLVSPFFIENYVHLHWDQSQEYCHFYVYFFTFHDLFVPLFLILLSAYISLKYSGATKAFGVRRPVYLICVLVAVALSFLVAIIPAYNSAIFMENPPNGKFQKECRTIDSYTMVLTFLVSSSLLFCFAMSFLFSLCIVGSPFLRNVFDRVEYVQRWRLLLTLSLVNGLFIVTGFLLNFKEISRIFFDCCDFAEPYSSLNSLTYDVWSFVLLITEPLFRPLVYLCFYFKFLWTDVNAY